MKPKKKPTKKKVVKRQHKNQAINGKRTGRPKTTVAEKLKKKTWTLEQVRKVEMLGLTDAGLANILEVDQRTIDNWKKDKDFVSVLKKGKEVADAEMIKSLYKSGMGFEYAEIKKEGNSIETIDFVSKVTKTTKYFPPVPASAIFWLKNRQGWVDRQEFNIPDDLEITIKLID